MNDGGGGHHSSPPRNSGAHDPLFVTMQTSMSPLVAPLLSSSTTSTSTPLTSRTQQRHQAIQLAEEQHLPHSHSGTTGTIGRSTNPFLPSAGNVARTTDASAALPPTPLTHAFLASPFSSSTTGSSSGDDVETLEDAPPLIHLARRDAVDVTAPGAAEDTTPAIGHRQQQPPPPTVPTGQDSITLGQLKAMTDQLPKTKQALYTFPSPPPDSSDLLSELEEFYSYVEVPQVIDHKDSFLAAWPHPQPFVETSKEVQLEHIQTLLDALKSTDAETRSTTARHLLYIAQGTFHSSSSPEHHLHLILSNVALLRSASALEAIWAAVKATGQRWEGVSHIPDPDAPGGGMAGHGEMPPQKRQEQLDEINGELALLFAVLYFMMEVHRGDEEWAEELMQLEPPMPIYLFNLVAGLRERNAKGYPVKKLLLLLWKSILACIGGMKDVERVKTLVRSIEGLPPDPLPKPSTDARPLTKVAPPDFASFRSEITAKYPSYVPPQISSLPTDVDRISAAAAPQPVRPTFSYHINPNHDPSHPSNQPPSNDGLPLPETPAPTPPQSPAPPKLKKQQYQTDQTRPFVLPFAPSNAGPRGGNGPRAVPRSIEEAGRLYVDNMRVSTELWQSWKLREEYLAEETGLAKAQRLSETSGAGATMGLGAGASRRIGGRLSQRMEALSLEDDDAADLEDHRALDPLEMLKRMEKSVMEEIADDEEDKVKMKALKDRVGDLRRLQRVEMLYRAVLPQLQSAVIVLLKLLLATVTGNSNLSQGANNPDSGNDEPIELSLEDMDIMRHREITSKAISAILILVLKWFKASHVMKFHYLSQLLVDSNCLLLILKMFGLQEVSTSVKSKNNRADQNFFKFCHDHVNPSSSSSPRPEDAMLKPPKSSSPSSSFSSSSAWAPDATASSVDPSSTDVARSSSPQAKGSGDEDEVELITDYSWRNFFSVINFVHILQKLTKRKTHRVLLLVQYKSSAILKRILKVSHPTLQLYVLKVIKSQVPYCGRKWRQSNMKVITAIYLNCRPDLRDEWLTGTDVDQDVEESLPHEQALRALVRFFNTKHYGSYAPQLHRRSSVTGNAAGTEFGPSSHSGPNGASMPLPSPGGGAGGYDSTGRPPQSPDDAFPPLRPITSFNFDDAFRVAHEAAASTVADDYNDYAVDDLLLYPRGVDQDGSLLDLDPLEASRADWDRLGQLVGEYDDISDSESVGSLSGLLRFDRDEDEEEDGTRSEGSEVSEFELEDAEEEQRAAARNEWEHISPETITALEEERAAALPHSPRPSRRRSSTGPISPALRPVLLDRDDDLTEPDRSSETGPAPAAPHQGPAVDEVELVFGE